KRESTKARGSPIVLRIARLPAALQADKEPNGQGYRKATQSFTIHVGQLPPKIDRYQTTLPAATPIAAVTVLRWLPGHHPGNGSTASTPSASGLSYRMASSISRR